MESPHLVLLDLILPGTDGIELMERVPKLASVPVIFLSGYGRDEIFARALESEASNYVFKPFSPTELVARIQSALDTWDRLCTVGRCLQSLIESWSCCGLPKVIKQPLGYDLFWRRLPSSLRTPAILGFSPYSK